MGGIICDSSTWIDFFSTKGTDQEAFLIQSILDDRPVYLCPVIVQEILHGVRSESLFQVLKTRLASFPVLQNDWLEASIEAAELYRTIRQQGYTIRKPNDCLIASYAIRHDLMLVHRDRDFEIIAACSKLKVY